MLRLQLAAASCLNDLPVNEKQHSAKRSGFHQYSKTCLKRPHKKKTKIVFLNQVSLNAGQKYCRMLQGEHSSILSTFIKLPLVVKMFVLSIFEWPLKTGFTVYHKTVKSVPHYSILH